MVSGVGLAAWTLMGAEAVASGQLRKLFFERFRLLAKNPFMGELREDLAPAVRMMGVGNYVILFRPTAGGIKIVQVVHAARHLAAIFRRF